METFTPDLGDLYLTLAGTGSAFAAMLYLAYRVSRIAHPDPRRRVLLPMLAYFGALLLLMTFLGTFWTTVKYPEIGIASDRIVIDGQEFPRPTPSNFRMEAVGRGSQTTERILLIQTRDRRNWAFPASRYDIRRMYGLLRE